MPVLYEIAETLRALMDMCDENDGLNCELGIQHLDDSVKQAIAETALEFDAKVEQVGLAIRELEGIKDVRLNEAIRLTKMAKRNQVLIERLKDYVKTQMIEVGASKIKGQLLTVSVCSNGGKTAIRVDDENVTQEFMVISRKIDHDKIRDFLSSGERLDFAEELPRGKHLRIN